MKEEVLSDIIYTMDKPSYISPLNIILSIILLIGIAFSIVQIVNAVTPDPGHPWTGVGDGTFVVTGPSVARTYTFPDANATIMTLGTAETITGAKTFGTSGAVGKLILAGSTSGSSILNAAAVAGGTTLTLPGTTGALALNNQATDTFGALTDITTNNATTLLHGFLPKLGGGTTNFLRADGTWAAPAGGSSGQPYYPTRQWCYLRPLGTTATVFTSVGCAAFVITGTPAASAQTNSYYIAHPSAATINTLAGVTQTFIQTQGQYRPKLTALIRTDSTIDNRRIWVALTSAALTTTNGTGALATRYVGVRYDTSVPDTQWQCASGDGTTGSVLTTGVTVAVSTAYLITVDWSVNGTLTCTVNGVSVNKTTNLDTTQTAALGIHSALTTLTAAARTMRTAFIHLETN